MDNATHTAPTAAALVAGSTVLVTTAERTRRMLVVSTDPLRLRYRGALYTSGADHGFLESVSSQSSRRIYRVTGIESL